MAGSLFANCGGKEKVRISPASAKRFRSFFHHQRQLPWKDTRFVGCGAMPGHGLMLTDPARPNTRKRIQESLRTFWLCNASHCATCWRTPALQDSALELQFNVFPTVKFHTHILGYWELCRISRPVSKMERRSPPRFCACDAWPYSETTSRARCHLDIGLFLFPPRCLPRSWVGS
jgi:hypothetical protein